MAINKVFLCFLGLHLALSLPQEQYYVNGDSSQAGQQLFYSYQPRSGYYYTNDINKPVFHPQLGMSPQYYDLVYNYVKDFAGTETPAHVNTVQPNVFQNYDSSFTQGSYPVQNENSQIKPADKVPGQAGSAIINNENAQNVDKPGYNEHFLPSDLFSLNNHPSSQFYGHLDAIKMKRMQPKSQPTSLPPLGGVVSNYVLLRSHSNPQNLLQLPGTVKENESNLQHIKRQTSDNSDGVVILAEPAQSSKMSEENEQSKGEGNEDNEDNKEEDQDTHPGIAQSKPSAIALAGPGGVAQASPVGTALVGQGGLAVAAPSGTAVAGPAGQGALPIQIGGEKQKTTEKSEESDSY